MSGGLRAPRYEPLLATALAGKSQAHVMNYEETPVPGAAPPKGSAEDLRFPVFVSGLTPDAVRALKATHRKLPKKVSAELGARSTNRLIAAAIANEGLTGHHEMRDRGRAPTIDRGPREFSTPPLAFGKRVTWCHV